MSSYPERNPKSPMCFGGQTYSPPNNPAPYTLENSQSAVQETSRPANSGGATQTALSAEAAQKDAQDKPTPAVNGYSITTGLNTSTL